MAGQSLQWWGRRFRLPRPLAGVSFTASAGAASDVSIVLVDIAEFRWASRIDLRSPVDEFYAALEGRGQSTA